MESSFTISEAAEGDEVDDEDRTLLDRLLHRKLQRTMLHTRDFLYEKMQNWLRCEEVSIHTSG